MTKFVYWVWCIFCGLVVFSVALSGSVLIVILGLWSCGVTITGDPVLKPSPKTLTSEATPKFRDDFMARWNVAASGVSGVGFDFDFRWRTWDRFPHPERQGGGKSAYHVYNAILVMLVSGNREWFREHDQVIRNCRLHFHSSPQVPTASFYDLVLDAVRNHRDDMNEIQRRELDLWLAGSSPGRRD